MGKRNVNTGMLIPYEPAAGVDSDPLAQLLAREEAFDEIDEMESVQTAAQHRRRGERERTIDGTDLMGASPAEVWDYHHRNSDEIH